MHFKAQFEHKKSLSLSLDFLANTYNKKGLGFRVQSCEAQFPSRSFGFVPGWAFYLPNESLLKCFLIVVWRPNSKTRYNTMKLYLSSDETLYVGAVTFKDKENRFVVHALCDLNSIYCLQM